ncbi:MAG: hypothetical protein Q8916_01535 [Bacteroidota bacterium]|nr:hypothetical protein [Bacteroidota bacterium]MDP4229068.1 hypothetical protein [Bacteroidota bacterium]MDP4237275.1 hypothetical protein [Bacteroidota bacterium]
MSTHFTADKDPEVLLPTNPVAAIVEAFNGLEESLRNLAELYGYPNAEPAKGISAIQFLYNTKILSASDGKAIEILRNLRNQALSAKTGVDSKSARKYIDLVAEEKNLIDNNVTLRKLYDEAMPIESAVSAAPTATKTKPPRMTA